MPAAGGPAPIDPAHLFLPGWDRDLEFVPLGPGIPAPPGAAAPGLAVPLFRPAATALARGEAVDPADLAWSLAFFLGHSPDSPKAVGCAALLLALAPDTPLHLTERGVAMAQRGELLEALWSLRAAVRLDPGLVAAQFNLGVCAWDLGRARRRTGRTQQAALLRVLSVAALERALDLGLASPHRERAERLLAETR